MDDKCANHMIERFVAVCKNNNCSIACCEVTTDSTELAVDFNVLPDVNILKQETAVRMLFEEHILSYLHSKIFDRTLFDEGLSLPEGMTFEDLYIMPEVFLRSDSVAMIREKLYFYWQDRPGNVSSSRSIKHSMNLSVAQRHRYDLAKGIEYLPNDTLEILLYRATRSSIGAYRVSVFKKDFSKERMEIALFLKRNIMGILGHPKLPRMQKMMACCIMLWGLRNQ